MIPNMNLSEAKGGSIEPGGYVLRILGTEIDMKYERLRLQVDIVEGPSQGHYTDLHERFGFWGLWSNLSLKKGDEWKFANAVDALRESNADFQWDDDGENDEHKMMNMCTGAILQRVHYRGNDGTEKTKLQVHHLVPVEDIRSGNFKIPDDSWKDGLGPVSHPAGVVDTTSQQMPQGFVESADETPF